MPPKYQAFQTLFSTVLLVNLFPDDFQMMRLGPLYISYSEVISVTADVLSH
jgi:hypothetical protein